jgi:hypothetical protein
VVDGGKNQFKLGSPTIEWTALCLVRAVQRHTGQVTFTVFSGAVWLPRTSVRPLNRTHRISPSFLNQIASYLVQVRQYSEHNCKLFFRKKLVKSSIRIMPRRSFNLKPFDATCEFAHVASQLQSSIEPVVLMPTERHQ